jgi:hypothetical protein
MRLDPNEIVGLGTFVLAGLGLMKAKRKWICISVMLVSAAFFVACLLSSNEPNQVANNQHNATTTEVGTNLAAVSTSGNNSPPTLQMATVTGTNINFIQAAAGATVTATFGQQPAPQDTKKDLRSILRMANPEILRWIDAGSNAIPVMLGTVGQVRLSEIAQRPDFKKYLSVAQTGDSITGNSNHMGTKYGYYINDIGENGAMSGFYFYPNSALKDN